MEYCLKLHVQKYFHVTQGPMRKALLAGLFLYIRMGKNTMVYVFTLPHRIIEIWDLYCLRVYSVVRVWSAPEFGPVTFFLLTVALTTRSINAPMWSTSLVKSTPHIL